MPRYSEQCPKWARPSAVILHALMAAAILATPATRAANLGRVVRKIADVAEDVPVQRIDEVVQNASTSRAGRELLEKLNAGKRLDNLAEESAALRRAWKDLLSTADTRIFREIESLPPASQRAALVVAHGGQRLKTVVPDLALRSRFIRDGGAETLAALGRFDDLADDAIRFDVALQAGKLPSPAGARALALNDFGTFFHTLGDRGHHFWTSYVRPHWKLWLGSTALAAVILAPDEYLDEIGNLTEKGTEKLGRFGGEVLSKAFEGTIRGVGTATQEVVAATTRSIAHTFFTSAAGLASACVLALAALLFISPTRRWLLGSVRRVFRGRRPADSLPTPPPTP